MTIYHKIFRSCHNSFGSFSGLTAPLYYLINKGKINSDHCIKNLGDYFAGLCIPGVDKPENNPNGNYDMFFYYLGCQSTHCKRVCGFDSH